MLTAMPCLPMVQNLHIREGNAMLLNAYDKRNYEMLGTEVCLKTLSISSCKDVVSLPREVMSCLSTSLQELKIDNCENLTSLSDGLRCLTVLKTLEISNCSQLASLPLLPDALQLLSIQNCEKMSFLPEVLQQAVSLQELVIGGFLTLAVLPKWLGNLTSLKELHIWNCPSLMRLPEEVLHLPRLEKLYIYECLQLARRYEMGKGEDWELISHIADVEIVSLKVLEG
ncbi:hypothetical protein QJS04_geneDACA007373 [Acorus gramineus]|uniref:R13L1/DRL21-like LRR repeat region domain-containing protein n=1 Tax=Acorus gramineus TaxID=55184 RepID=A0AAV9BRU6_ACOGR|nr:hypothetical protein QJS04_geneDACA007373 [Acorus gramineus]